MGVLIEEVSVSALRASLDGGEFTIRQLVEACLDRIEAMDKVGPRLNAVIEINAEALTIADRLDVELAGGTLRGQLHGIPILLKDNIATADGMENTAGSLALVGAKPTRDAFITNLLRDAGAVIVGKTNLSEWANIRSSWSSSGWSGRGGQTVNPYVLDRNPSGSSSGSGVAVAASYVPLAVGTETNGSIVAPATASGIVGLKPTIGLVSRRGIIPISHSQDSAGPMARSVRDAAIMLNVLAAVDPDDPAHASSDREYTDDAPRPGFPVRPASGFIQIDYTANLDTDGLRGARIGVLREPDGFRPAVDAIYSGALTRMQEAGAELIDPVEIATRKDVESDPACLDLMLWELKHGIANYLNSYTDPAFPIRTIHDIVQFNRDHAEEELRYFDQGLLEQSALKSGLNDPEYIAKVSKLQRMARVGLDSAFDAHRLDAIVAPTGSPAAKIDLVDGDHRLGGSSTLSAVAGYPILSVPAGYHFGLPVGISFIGRAWSEAMLLRLGHAFEQISPRRRPPRYLPGAVFPAE